LKKSSSNTAKKQKPQVNRGLARKGEPWTGLRSLFGVPVVVDLLAKVVLRSLEVGFLLFGQVPAVLGFIRRLAILDRIFTVFQMSCLAGIQLAILNSVSNAVLLVLFPLVDVILPTMTLFTAAGTHVGGWCRLRRGLGGGSRRCRSRRILGDSHARKYQTCYRQN